MARSIPACIAGALLAGPLSSQGGLPLLDVVGPVKDGGTYHLATASWTHAGAHSAFGADVLYNNVTPISYFTTMPDHSVTPFAFTDDGRIPSLSDTGDGFRYKIDGLTFAYCSSSGLGQNLVYQFGIDESNRPCEEPGLGSSGGATITGLPSSPAAGVQTCWAITIDLAGSTNVIEVLGDADGIYHGNQDSHRDSFGYTFSFSGHGSDQTTGPIFAGDPPSFPRGDGTSNFGYGPGPAGTGLGQEDLFWIESQLLPRGCYYFGGYPVHPWLGFHVRLMGSPTETSGPTGYCTATHSNTVSAEGALLISERGFGTASASFELRDVPDNCGLLFAGPDEFAVPFGCGERCVGGATTLRGPVIVPSGNHVSNLAFDMSPAAARNIQYWYRDPMNPTCHHAPWNLSNALEP